jgi:hypothetical protein
MVQFLSISFFSWISSIFVGFFNSSRFFVSSCIWLKSPRFHYSCYIIECPAISESCKTINPIPICKLLMNYSNQYSVFFFFFSDSTAHASSHSKQAANWMCVPYHNQCSLDGHNSIPVRDNVTWRLSWACSSLISNESHTKFNWTQTT